MKKPGPLQLAELQAKPAKKPAAASTATERTTVIYARVPWSLGEKLRDLARERSRAEARRVTVNELVAEAIGKLSS